MGGTIISIVISIILIVVGFLLSENHVEIFDVTFVAFGVLMLTATATSDAFNQDKPTAIDVYRGKTTLKITYVDSVAVDTVVVFKEQ